MKDKTAKKGGSAPPSTAIDIDSPTPQRRPKKSAQSPRKPALSPLKPERQARSPEKRTRIQRYSGELVKGEDNKFRMVHPKHEIAFEPSIGASDFQPDEGIDSGYPAQRLIISNVAEKPTCCCHKVRGRPYEKRLKNKSDSLDQGVVSERIRGELKRLDVILNELDD
ncbi:hypothetical protein KIN20_033422 [Parelaphostrongylus tenuis]|uniref:Uncharacterized protein n=1 Tax=Parelaphostrongylus tenuis TaxID=148309 RepID=A0AAD5WI88_PARTN|nr:hypothetical protein KIN20_033422 [Parelaphostrongylus tenuis]